MQPVSFSFTIQLAVFMFKCGSEMEIVGAHIPAYLAAGTATFTVSDTLLPCCGHCGRSEDSVWLERGRQAGWPSDLPIDGHGFRRVEVLTGAPRRPTVPEAHPEEIRPNRDRRPAE